jgi:hypothetical protein
VSSPKTATKIETIHFRDTTKHREQEDSGERMAAEPRDRGSSVDSNASDGSANPPGVLRCGTLEKPHGKK